jgi:hypothetical protein
MRNDSTRGGGGSRFLYEPFGSGQSHEDSEYWALLRSLGTPEQIGEKLRAIDELLEERRRRDWLIRAVRAVATWAAAVATGWLAFRGLLSDFFGGLKP